MTVSPRRLFVPIVFVLAGALAACAAPDYPACSNDTACRRDGHHEYCLMGRCQQCRTAADCGAGQACNAGRCEAPQLAQRSGCSDDAACGAGRTCVAGQCQTAAAGDLATRSSDGGACTFPSPHFPFDEATLTDADRRELQPTADCLRREAHTHYVLIGRADPRGTAEYNLMLGARRARAVQTYLVALGIDGGRLAPSSEGSEGATGTSASGWANDRRVDPTQREAAHSP